MKKIKIFTGILLVSGLVGLCGCGMQRPYLLTVGEGFVEPVGFHDATPTFSWKLPEDVKKQTAYQIEVTKAGSALWDSGWVESDQSAGVHYGGEPLASRDRLKWRVRFRDEKGRTSNWSKPAYLELGLLSAKDWKAKWIQPGQKSEPNQEPIAYLRRQFEAKQNIETARLYVTARGMFELRLNGNRVGNDHFANGWTSYHNRLDTLTYDVTCQLQAGNNTLLAMLGKGWYAGRLGWNNQTGIYGNDPELLLQLEIAYADGSVETIMSDENWQATWQGPILSSGIYNGESYDARKPISGWKPVTANADLGDARLTPKPFTPVRETETLTVKEITEPEPGRFVFDLGQNMVGWARVKIPVKRNETVTIRFAEMLNKDGTLYTANYRSAKSTDTYTAAATSIIEWEPHFTFHGFRYVELSGLPANARPQKDWVTGVVLHSDLRKIGKFESSHVKLNQLQSNIVWGQRGNFVDIPTDCPQRDERMGWTGDAQVFCSTSMFNYDCHAFWKSWLGSMRDDQLPDGRIPHVIPEAVKWAGSPGWMDAAAIIPWEVYVRTGDMEVLTENFEMMEKLVGWYRSQSTDGLIRQIKAFGDWLQPYSGKREGDTPVALIGTAYYAHSVRLLATCAGVLKRDEDAKRYTAEADLVKQAFAKHYFDSDGKLRNAPQTQTGYLLAIAFDLIPPEMQKNSAAHLVRLVHDADNHLRTGFLGTPYIVGILDRMGYADLAFEVLFKESYPSWFYSINQGATTMWERWNSYSHEDGFGDAGMNSFNHYAYGAIGRWMYERIAGLAPDPANPGYKHFFIRPLIARQLDWTYAELETPYGKASSGWRKKNGKIEMYIVVPPNTTATIEFPNGRKSEMVTAGTYHYRLEQKK
ncbi:MAG: family 78 glycoside hydrolase catalytic domain [Sedimentisphaerales bacterium]|nr:family 78 glycoside hydrolase catalytic domain [Sedimentisphaerales bacterium]